MENNDALRAALARVAAEVADATSAEAKCEIHVHINESQVTLVCGDMVGAQCPRADAEGNSCS